MRTALVERRGESRTHARCACWPAASHRTAQLGASKPIPAQPGRAAAFSFYTYITAALGGALLAAAGLLRAHRTGGAQTAFVCKHFKYYFAATDTPLNVERI